ncbi:MAG: polysaccharide pyruvyl transferase family protein [Rhodospirillaceae bacterium]|nr:polysaccharide pyruvyl transferase family protein [Rhodospirillaceae bacterium]
MASATNVCILNDTSEWYHWGCHGSSLGLRGLVDRRFQPETITIVPIKMSYAPSHLPETPEEMSDLRSAEAFLKTWPAAQSLIEADGIVINGEGTLHGFAAHVKRLLFIMAICGRVLNKRVHLVNHSVFPPVGDPAALAFYRAAYHSAHHVAVRESDSLRILRERFGLAARLAFDCLPLTLESAALQPRRDGADYAVITGTSAMDEARFGVLKAGTMRLVRAGLRVIWLLGAPKNPATDEADQARLCAAPLGAEVVAASSFEEWARLIRDARFVFSGRFHYVIARLCLGGPFVSYGGNTPKIAAMLRDLNLPGLLVEAEADAVPTIDLANRIAFPPRAAELAERARANMES